MAQGSRPRRYRHDLDGLRGVAIALVALYHVFAGTVSGGVDVFLTLSGFFLLISLTSREGRLQDQRLRTTLGALGQAWLRIAKRLLPAAIVTLAGILVASVSFLPRAQWEETARQALASLLYVENWRLIAIENDYEAAGLAVSPMQHFWSLSVQGQLFLVVPLLVLLLVWASRRLRRGNDPHTLLWVTVGAAAAASFTWAVLSVQHDQPVAYYDTAARAWQILVGGLAALSLPRLARVARSTPEAVRSAVGHLALAAIVACGFLVDGGRLFPGWAAWWPVGATLLLIWTGSVPTRFGADRLLATWPARWLGDHAYSFYLWHWPVLIVYLEFRGQQDLAWPGGGSVLVASLGLAVLTRRWIEAPMRRFSFRSLRGVARHPRRGWSTVATAAATTTVALGVTVGAAQAYIHEVEKVRATLASNALYASPDHVGALALTRPGMTGSRRANMNLLPPVHLAQGDKPEELRREGCILRGSLVGVQPTPCVIHPEQDGPVVALVGGSHSYQFLPALRHLAENRGFTLVGYLAAGCPWGDEWLPTEPEFRADKRECREYSDRVTEVLVAEEPDLVISTATRSVEPFGTGGDHVPRAYRRVWERAVDGGLDLLLLRHNPGLPKDPIRCVENHLPKGVGAANRACGIPRAAVLSTPSPADRVPGADVIDTSDLYCRPTYCNVIEGNVVMYRNEDHITTTYMRTMAPALDQRIGRITGWWDGPLPGE